VERERRLLSHLIRTLDEGRHPALQALRALLDQDPPDPERLRALGHLLMLLPADPLAGPGEAMPGRIGAQLVGMALDRWAGYLPPGALRQPLTEILRALRFHGPALAEALAALLGAFWLRGEDPAWALEWTTVGNFIIIYFSHETLGLGSSAGDQLYHCLAVVSGRKASCPCLPIACWDDLGRSASPRRYPCALCPSVLR
jgi:hypothetical protein